MSTHALAPVDRQAPIIPLDTKQVAAAMTAYQEGLKSILDDSDWQVFEDKKGEPKRFLKRSGWRKIAFWFGLDLQIVTSEVERDQAGNPLRARVIARATHPNGRHADGDGYCSVREPRVFQKPENDVPATAATRAMNRAISNLVGMGDVSAEEIDGAELLEQAYGPEASAREQSGIERALHVIYGPAGEYGGYDPAPLLTRLQGDAGGYLPRIVARAVMLVAAHRPGRQTGAGTQGVEPDQHATPAGSETADAQAPDSRESGEVAAESGEEPGS
jgi:hypothetical protein